MRAISILVISLFFAVSLPAQQLHSHNDYEQAEPFHAAYKAGFASIEADIYLVDGKLLVAHDLKDVDATKTLEALYIKPLADVLGSNKQRKLQLLIDIKSAAVPTLDAVVKMLKNYPSLIRNKNITITISGNRPAVENYERYPSFIYFDGRPGVLYRKKALKKVSLISDAYGNYVRANIFDDVKARAAIDAAHQLGRPFRLWAHPDHESGWKRMITLGVDFINTDRIEALAKFMLSSE